MSKQNTIKAIDENQWGRNVDKLSSFYIDTEKLSVIQDLMFSSLNVMLTGDPGTGKTELCQRLASAHNLPFHRVNVGAIRTPRDWLGIGNSLMVKLYSSNQNL